MPWCEAISKGNETMSSPMLQPLIWLGLTMWAVERFWKRKSQTRPALKRCPNQSHNLGKISE